MNLARAILLLAAGVFATAGIKSEYLRKEKFAGFKSFSWQECAGLNEDLVLRGVLTDQNLRDAVYPQLEKRGMVEAITAAELAVHCEAYTGVRDEPDRSAAGRGQTGIYTVETNPSLRVTIRLEVRQADSGNPIWRASISDPLSVLKNQKSLNRAVQKAFGK